METNQYEQILIKCEYINAVCDELLKQLDTSVLSKVHQNNKLLLHPQLNSISNKFTLLQRQNNDEATKDQQQHQARKEQLQTEIKQNQLILKKLKQQITFLKQSKYDNLTNTKLTNKKMRDSSALQSELNQFRRLLNSELQNLNSLQISGIELKEALETYDQKETSLKNKLNKIINQQKEYLQFRQMEEGYQSLLQSKRKLVEESTYFQKSQHELTFKKILSIAQSNQNLQQMQKYQKQLTLLIKEQTFIINQIQSRQMQTQTKNQQDIQDDTEVFEQQISNLRKTIANRKFRERTKHIHTSNKLQTFVNNSTPKNNIKQSSKKEDYSNKQHSNQNSSSIFKIQIQPVSHFISPTNVQTENSTLFVQRNSLPSKNQKKSQAQHIKNSYHSQNKLPDFETVEIKTLQKILKKKQDQIKYALENGKPENVNYSVPVFQNNHKAPTKKYERFQHSIHTETIQTNRQNDIEIGPNSRFIEKIIKTRNTQNLSRLKDNVRIRTKKSESEKYKHFQREKNYSNQQKSKRKNTSPNKPSISQHLIKTPKNNKKIIDTREEDNEFLQQNSPILKKVQFSEHKIKYKDKISDLGHENKSINSVFKKIDQLNNNRDSEKQKEGKIKQPKPQKMKIFKLSSKRKYGNSISFQRKGKALGIEESQSEESLNLPKIQEQDQSIRNTLKSMAQNQNST